MEIKIKQMLITAYLHIGVKDPEDLADRVAAALDYLEKDRERYIEVAAGASGVVLLNISAKEFATSLIVAAAERRSLIARSNSLTLLISVSSFLGLLVFHSSADLTRQTKGYDAELQKQVNQFLFGSRHRISHLVHSFHLHARGGLVVPLTPTPGHQNAVWPKNHKNSFNKFFKRQNSLLLR